MKKIPITILILTLLTTSCKEEGALVSNPSSERNVKVRLEASQGEALVYLRELIRNGEWDYINQMSQRGKKTVYHITDKELELLEMESSVERVK